MLRSRQYLQGIPFPLNISVIFASDQNMLQIVYLLSKELEK